MRSYVARSSTAPSRASNSSVSAYWNSGQRVRLTGDVGDQPSDQTGLDGDVELSSGKCRCRLELIGPECHDADHVLGEQLPHARVDERPIVEIGAQRHEHMDRAVGSDRGLGQQREKSGRLRLIDHREQLFELV